MKSFYQIPLTWSKTYCSNLMQSSVVNCDSNSVTKLRFWHVSPHIWHKVYFCTKIIVLCIKNQNHLWVGHFLTLSGHFLVNYINILHKIELQTVILMCLTCLNGIWIKSYDIKHIFLFPFFFCNFVKKVLKIYDSF